MMKQAFLLSVFSLFYLSINGQATFTWNGGNCNYNKSATWILGVILNSDDFIKINNVQMVTVESDYFFIGATRSDNKQPKSLT